MRNFDYSSGVRSIWSKDAEFQHDCIEGIVRNIRHADNTALFAAQVKYLENIGAFYVHIGEYLIEHFGQQILSQNHGIFIGNSICTLAGRLAIPLLAMNGSTLGFVGYSNKPDDWPNDAAWVKYMYPPKYIFDKGRYMFISREEYMQSLADGYICIVDGLFDKISLSCLGINAVSLCGSALTKWHKYYLSFIPHKIVIADNDIAGRRLSRICQSQLTNCVEIRQPYTSDVDDMLKDNSRCQQLLKCISLMKSEGFLLSKTLRG